MDPLLFEKLIIQLLFRDPKSREKLLPFLRPDIFETFEVKELISNILSFSNSHKKFPSIAELKVVIQNKDVYSFVSKELEKDYKEDYDENFIKGELETFFKNKIFYNELYTALEALKNEDESAKNEAPDKLREALAFNFDTDIGLDFFESGDKLFEYLHHKDNVIPTGIDRLDKLIKGGFHEKTLTLFMAETNLGKSLVKIAFAANCLLQNKNVLYITLEMAEEKVSERIMSNVFDFNINDLQSIPKVRFLKKFDVMREKILSKIIIKEFPTRSSNTNRIRNLLKELELKKNFVPDIVFVDYLGIMLPNRINKSFNTNTELKVISEELRGLAMEKGIPIVSSVQTNRGGFSSAEIDLTDIAESIGTTNAADIIFGITQTPEMRAIDRFCFILLKNRFGLNRLKCSVGVTYDKMRLYDVVDDDEDEQPTSVGVSHGKPSTPPGTKSTELVDEAAAGVLKTFKQNRKTEKKKILDVNM